jgi:hypothetical protein
MSAACSSLSASTVPSAARMVSRRPGASDAACAMGRTSTARSSAGVPPRSSSGWASAASTAVLLASSCCVASSACAEARSRTSALRMPSATATTRAVAAKTFQKPVISPSGRDGRGGSARSSPAPW